MQRQKTIAKWLAVILLCTVAVGAYIFYDAVYVKGKDIGSGQTAAGDNTQTPTDNKEPEPIPHEPFYTTLPRPAETINGHSVQHTGGEDEDVLCDALFLGRKTFVIFSSKSNEFDCRGKGLYLAIFEDDSLLSVTELSGNGSEYTAGKLTSLGVIILIKQAAASKLYLFSTDGEPKGEKTFSAYDEASMYLWDKTLWIFYKNSGRLRAATVGAGLMVEESPFYYASPEIGVDTVVENGTEITLFCQLESATILLSFSQYKGFKLLKTLTNLSILQISSLPDSDGAITVLLGKTDDALVVINFDGTYQITAQKAIENKQEGLLFTTATEIKLIMSGTTHTYCKHLDLISANQTNLAYDTALSCKTYGGNAFVLTRGGTTTALYKADAQTSSFTEIMSIKNICSKTDFVYYQGNAYLAFSSEYALDILRMNFGQSDVFLLRKAA